MQFRHLANEVGNLERPFLREYFPRWVGSSGCPVLKYEFSELTINLLCAFSWYFSFADTICFCPFVFAYLLFGVLRMGFSYNKRKNIVELASLRGCTTTPDSKAANASGITDTAKRDGDVGWPGMMSIRVHELDGMYDHPVLPMAGEKWQLLEIQCHSRLAAKRFQKSKKGPKHDGSDDNVDSLPAVDLRSKYVLIP